ncbi:diphosphoinositol polyphosphate phosphohydrolase 1 isoform X1 [Galendromus occidentalis]|uniref:diphosphoinositol-polyphosphate diphosphatase n=1 Tax=Galendromus occidentalis TaxID=34638 RepID=A0AAJ7WI38_9ACAR|nr:diphosphoinositol polyphosphate phosphohydrolase 1 isoform X1 [Galendromus occidentalis]
MKEKPNSTRTYDGEGFRRRAACLCVRDAGETEILLVSSSSSPDRFIVPGGGLEPEEDAPAAATREVMEEAGVRGTLGRYLGVFEVCPDRRKIYIVVAPFPESLMFREHSLVRYRFGGSCSKYLLEFAQNLERRHRTQVFVLRVEELLDEWDDSKSIGRKRKWFTVSEALEELTVSKPIQCNYVELLQKRDNEKGDDDSGGEGNAAVE